MNLIPGRYPHFADVIECGPFGKMSAAGMDCSRSMQIKRMIIASRLRSNGTPMHEIESQIEIAATRERVWSILTDFPAYPSWNPFIRSIDGPVEKGKRLSVTRPKPALLR
jgi:hypothetical protein